MSLVRAIRETIPKVRCGLRALGAPQTEEAVTKGCVIRFVSWRARQLAHRRESNKGDSLDEVADRLQAALAAEDWGGLIDEIREALRPVEEIPSCN